MKISQISELLNAKVLCCEDLLDSEVCSACGSDMMSDVLAFVKNQAVLLTGLVNPQVIRTAEMVDLECIVFVRDKVPTKEIIDMARENDMVLMTTWHTLYCTSGILYSNGLTGIGRRQ